MRNPARIALLLTLLLCAAGSTLAQSPTDFYLGLLGRGASYVEAGQYDAAVSPLRISAFGLVESIANYQSALVYLAIAQDRAGNADGARDAVRRLASAERIERHFGSLQLPATIRSAFLDVAKKHLAPTDANALATGGAISAAPKTQPSVTTRPAQSSTQPQTTPQQQPPASTQSQPAKPQPQTTKPAEPKPAPAQTTTTPAPQQPKKTADAKPAEPKPAVPQTTTSAPPAVKPPAPQPATTNTPAPVQTKPALSAKDVGSRIAAAERALTNAQLNEARRLYRELLDVPGLDRESLLRVVEGLYRARDFNGALTAFKTLGTLRRGEEPYGYYHAVALYETGAYDQARKVLGAAIPFIEMTPDVVRYRTRIEGAH
ncbi:MAG TPA: hypothetical protein VHW00_23715 [Thermoanaerobaculia bacterium]|nr:hypothetical protein [Thermoanaerobaculia bacterium]